MSGAVVGWALAVIAVCAGVGWLYLLRDVQALGAGPDVSGALPLEELAGHASQPLVRMAAAWLPAGIAVGLALSLGARLRAVWAAVACAVLTVLILGSTTAASEAVSRNESLGAHVGPALSRSGLWTAVGLAVIGSLLAAAAAAARPRGPAGGATGSRRRGSSAA